MATSEMSYQDLLNYISANKSLEDRYYTNEGWLSPEAAAYGYGAGQFGSLDPFRNTSNDVYRTYDIPGVGRVQYDPQKQTFNQFDGGMFRNGNEAQGYTETSQNGMRQDTVKADDGWMSKLGSAMPTVVPALMAVLGGAAAMGAGSAGAGAAAGAAEGATGAAALPAGGMTATGTTAPWATGSNLLGTGFSSVGAPGALSTELLGTGLASTSGVGAATGTGALTGGLNTISDYLSAANSALKSPLGSLASSAISGIMGSRAADKAADAQTAAAQDAIAEQRRQYDQTRADLAPYRNRGYQAGNQLAVMMGLRPDAATYGNGDPTADPNWMKGVQTAPKYQAPTANAFAQYTPFKRG